MTENKELAMQDQLDSKTLLALITSGDMAGLDPERKMAYYKARCEAAGLDPRTAPFQFIRLQGKETLYATKNATDQLTKAHKIAVEVLEQKTENDIRVVMVRARAADGRQTDEMGATPVAGLKGAELANAYMKAITKAKRRAVLSLCGLGTMDETEIETVSNEVSEEIMPKPLELVSALPAIIEPDPLAEDAIAEVPKKNSIQLVPIKIVPEKNPAGGFIYNVYDDENHLWVTTNKTDALALKSAIETKTSISICAEGNKIISVAIAK